MHPTITTLKQAVDQRDETLLLSILADDVRFSPPTYWATWTGKEPVAALLVHVAQVFEGFEYRRILGHDREWSLEFTCKIGTLDAVGVDLIGLNDSGLIDRFEVLMRPHRSVGALREAMNTRVMSDPRFLKFRDALG